MGVEALTRERQPTGAIQRAEDAANGEQAFALLIALEDTNWLQNDDKRRTREFVNKATRRIELSRLPTCSWWQITCRRMRRDVQREIDSDPDPP